MGEIVRDSVKEVGPRQIGFVVNVRKRDVHAVITAEAVLDMPSDKIGDAEMSEAVERVKRDAHHTFSWKVEEMVRAGTPSGSADEPLFINSISFRRPA